MLDLERLKELEKAATPGSWLCDERVGCVAVYAGEQAHCMSDAGKWAIHYKGGAQVLDEQGNFKHWEVDPQVLADFRLTTAARNALPDLIAKVERLGKLCKECFTAATSWDKNDDRWMILAQEVTVAIRGGKEVAK